jgi:DmsE family decaheme c-type cytochrome
MMQGNSDKGVKMRGALVLLLAVLAAGFVIFAAGCESLKQAPAIMPMEEYQRLLVGRLDANYVGTNNCLAACHTHDRIRRDFEASTMGAQLSSGSGMPLVDCESCHGPGSLAVQGLKAADVEAAAARGETVACDYKTFIQIEGLPPTASSLMCLKCHTANATFNLHEWNAGAHAQGDVTCAACHNIHAGPDLIVNPRETKDMCFQCHADKKAEFGMRSHHPVIEDKVFCTDCHDPHGTSTHRLLREPTVRETCLKCHADKGGPFVYEHADLNEDCLNCHRPHGSPVNSLLNAQEFFLCMQCHSGHSTSGTAEGVGAFYTRCTDCHAMIHGSDLPSLKGRGTFVR